MSASQLVKKPAGLSFEEAAASVMTGLTAMSAMRDVGQVRPGTWVLINGASGGKGATNVKFVRIALNRENLNALVRLLRTDDVSVVVEQTYPFDKTASAVTHVLEHHARGKVAIAL